MTELLVTMVVVAILSAIAVASFIDFREDARIRVAEKFAHDMFASIGMKDLYVQMECNALKVALEDVQENNITTVTCDPSIVPVAQRRFVNMHPEDFPVNPRTNRNDITHCGCVNPCDTSCFSVNAGYCLHPISRTFFGVQLGCRGLASATTTGGGAHGGDGEDAEDGENGGWLDGDSGTGGGGGVGADSGGGTGGGTTDGGAGGDADGGSGSGSGGTGGGGGAVTDGEDECDEEG